MTLLYIYVVEIIFFIDMNNIIYNYIDILTYL
jgi:hypothetical protein